MTRHRTPAVALGAAGLIAVALAWTASGEAQPPDKGKAGGKNAPAGESNQTVPQPQLIEHSYPLADAAARQKSVKVLQQVTVDLLALFNLYKEAHWNMSGPLYLFLHEYYQEEADIYRTQSDIFAERCLHLGFSIDGRYSTVAKTSSLPDFPAGLLTDDQTLRLLVERVTIFQKEVYDGIHATNESDPTTSNKLQDLAYFVDKNLWQLRSHLQRPGSPGDHLPWDVAAGNGGNAPPPPKTR